SFFFSSRRRHTGWPRDWSSDVCSSDLFAQTCVEARDKLAVAVEASAWDGEWYRRAYFDDGTPLGTATGVECQIDSIAQSWSVLRSEERRVGKECRSGGSVCEV